uniref:Uncharacterized protein n=1 Tax=Arundo donax TaxID=35708 RepID=A0A0A9BUG6_ARUDO
MLSLFFSGKAMTTGKIACLDRQMFLAHKNSSSFLAIEIALVP